jgi:hypothetical protein
MTWGWLCGWSVDRDAFGALCEERLPAFSHQVEAPTREGRERLLAAGVDRIGGYSLGAWLLLDAAACGWAPSGPVSLLAPFLGFPAEAGRGGRIRKAQLRIVERGLAADPRAVVLDFAKRAGLTLPPAQPPVSAELAEGLEWLQGSGLSTLPAPAAQWKAFIGADDRLVDPGALAVHWPGLRVVAGAGHDPAALLVALAADEESHHAL